MVEQRKQLKRSNTFSRPAAETPHSELTHRKKQEIQPIQVDHLDVSIVV